VNVNLGILKYCSTEEGLSHSLEALRSTLVKGVIALVEELLAKAPLRNLRLEIVAPDSHSIIAESIIPIT